MVDAPLARAPGRAGARGATHLAAPAAAAQLLPPPRYRVVLGVVPLPSYHFWKDSSSRVYEPVAHLQHGQVGLLRQRHLLGVVRVGVVPVVVEPALEDLDGVLGQVAAPLARHRAAAGRVVLRRVRVAVVRVRVRVQPPGARQTHVLLALGPAVRVVRTAG